MHAERVERQPITGSGADPQRGPEAEPLVRGSGRQSFLEAENLLAFGAQRKQQICFILQTVTDLPTPSSRVKTHQICINLRNDLWQKWGGHVVHPVATP